MDYRELLAYAKSQRKKVSELTQAEKKSFTLSNCYITISLRQLSARLQGSNAGIFWMIFFILSAIIKLG